MKKPRVVVDTNVFISAALLKGVASTLMELWKEDKFIFLLSAEIFDEYFKVMARPKFHQEEKDLRELAEILTHKAEIIEPRFKLNVIHNDPSDNKFLECALAGKADFILSGDQHLLHLKKFKGIPILKTSEFFEKF